MKTREKTLHRKMLDAGVPCHGHYSDLYVPVNETTTKIIEEHKATGAPVAVSKFINQVEGGQWYDLAFQYCEEQ